MADPQTAHDVSGNEQHSPLPWTWTRGNVNDISDATDKSLMKQHGLLPMGA